MFLPFVADPGIPLIYRHSTARRLLVAAISSLAVWPATAEDASRTVAEARRLAAAGLAREAIEHLERLATGDAEVRDRIRVVAEIAAIRFQSLDYAGAAGAYRRLVRLAPQNLVARRNLAVSLYRAQRFAEARDSLDALPPATVAADARLRAVRGLLAAAAGDVEAGITDLEAAAGLDPGDTFANYELGLLLLARGEPRGAAAALSEAVRRDPSSGSAHYNLGQALLRDGRGEAGRAALAAAAEITRRVNEEQSLRQRGVALAIRAQEALDRGDAAAALADLEAAAEIFPGDPQLIALLEQASRALQGASP